MGIIFPRAINDPASPYALSPWFNNDDRGDKVSVRSNYWHSLFEGHALFPQVIQRASKVKPEKAFSIPVIEIDKYF
ncbi:hypothetical protein SMG44B_20577 [Stenotrophomonas maltophilia]|nr:hypothetical protein BN1263320027 [Stenotrophomonas maltophilia]